MPVHLVHATSLRDRKLVTQKVLAEGDQKASFALHIGLVNNMPDAALEATERQFVSLLTAASQGIDVRLSLYTLPGVARSAQAVAYLGERYLSVESLWEQSLDGLIVTGAEPIMPNLVDEPYWEALTKIVAWASEHTHSTIWSCLAAHAAILKMDGIGRVRSTAKHFGIFECTQRNGHPLMNNVTSPFKVPHSRWNGVSAVDLEQSGYSVLSRTSEHDVDIFLKEYKSLFIFFQGHPEYEADTLLREYRRDLLRYLRGETEVCAGLPVDYFDGRTERALRRLLDQAGSSRSNDVSREMSAILQRAVIVDTWTPAAICLYRNWLEQVMLRKSNSNQRAAASIANSRSISPGEILLDRSN